MESATMNVPNVVETAIKENVAGRDATTPTRLSATIEKTEEDCLVFTGIVSILNAVSTTKRISIIQLLGIAMLFAQNAKKFFQIWRVQETLA